MPHDQRCTCEQNNWGKQQKHIDVSTPISQLWSQCLLTLQFLWGAQQNTGRNEGEIKQLWKVDLLQITFSHILISHLCMSARCCHMKHGSLIIIPAAANLADFLRRQACKIVCVATTGCFKSWTLRLVRGRHCGSTERSLSSESLMSTIRSGLRSVAYNNESQRLT